MSSVRGMRQPLEMMRQVVAEPAHRPALERRQVGTDLERVGAQRRCRAANGSPVKLRPSQVIRPSLLVSR